MSTTWNPADKTSNIVLSGSNTIATNSINSNEGVRSTTSKLPASGGKWYAEFNTVQLSNGNDHIGLFTASVGLTSTLVGTANTAGWTKGGAICWNAGADILGAPDPSGSIVGLALDLDDGLFWMRLGTGLWNNTVGADPTTGTGGITAGGITAALFLATRLTANSGAPHVTLNASGPFANGPPTNFIGWDVVPPFTQTRGMVTC